ncbi:MAG: tetratricopeptide repeat protein [Spirochaetota bacterium]|nr:tetratricopeptide repeat protein [Spirochaetota bacterium]
MYSKNDVIYCTGGSRAATLNNRAAKLMGEGNYQSAAKELSEGLTHAPLFYPYRYNIGICHIHLTDYKMALLNLRKAMEIFPEYSKTYIQIGYIYQRSNKDDIAIEYYRKALARNNKELRVFSLIGDIYFDRNQLEMAKKYYEASLNLKPRNGRGLLGMAKLHYKRKEYYKSIVQIKSIAPGSEYDISLHYYYAECAYKLQDYQTAYDEYNILLKYKNDKFFLTNSVGLIKHKLDLCRRFIER